MLRFCGKINLPVKPFFRSRCPLGRTWFFEGNDSTLKNCTALRNKQEKDTDRNNITMRLISAPMRQEELNSDDSCLKETQKHLTSRKSIYFCDKSYVSMAMPMLGRTKAYSIKKFEAIEWWNTKCCPWGLQRVWVGSWCYLICRTFWECQYLAWCFSESVAGAVVSSDASGNCLSVYSVSTKLNISVFWRLTIKYRKTSILFHYCVHFLLMSFI